MVESGKWPDGYFKCVGGGGGGGGGGRVNTMLILVLNCIGTLVY